MPEYGLENGPSYFELWYASGELLERSNSLGGEDLGVEGSLELPLEPTIEPRHWTATLPDGRQGATWRRSSRCITSTRRKGRTAPRPTSS
jgi:hypothetical protein